LVGRKAVGLQALADPGAAGWMQQHRCMVGRLQALDRLGRPQGCRTGYQQGAVEVTHG
jgi:hypothetical protein